MFSLAVVSSSPLPTDHHSAAPAQAQADNGHNQPQHHYPAPYHNHPQQQAVSRSYYTQLTQQQQVIWLGDADKKKKVAKIKEVRVSFNFKFCHKKEEDTMRIWSLACGEV